MIKHDFSDYEVGLQLKQIEESLNGSPEIRELYEKVKLLNASIEKAALALDTVMLKLSGR